MADQDLFEKDKNKSVDDPTKNKDGVNDDKTTNQLLASIVNEDGEQKYKTEEEAIKALSHSQDFIKTLQSENAELKDKGNASDKLDELLEAVKQSKDSGEGGDLSPTMKSEDVLNIVKDYFTDTKAAETREDNINSVIKAFKDRYGKDASEKLYGKANDLGLSKEEINSMIANNPNAALTVLGVELKKQPVIDPTALNSQVDASNFREAPPSKPKSIMGGTKSKDLQDAWEASKQRTLKRLNINVET